ncbi:MAG: hypothetical protein CL910_19770 [Deltaproteobacteria bacterium]|jgi:hypothetical protein|nr:hypothetical protein [Deltaproteobacteria bacterium]
MRAPLVGELREHGFDPEVLVEGLDCSVGTLQVNRQTIGWDAFTVILERSARLLGGGEALEDLAFRNTERQLPRMIRSLLPGLRGAKPLFLMGARWLGPWMFRATRATCEELADGRLREVIEILPPHRGSPEFFWLTRGIMRAGPRLLGLPEAVVESRISERTAEYVITLPPRPRRRLFGRARRPERMSEERAELGFQQEQLRESLRRVAPLYLHPTLRSRSSP